MEREGVMVFVRVHYTALLEFCFRDCIWHCNYRLPFSFVIDGGGRLALFPFICVEMIFFECECTNWVVWRGRAFKKIWLGFCFSHKGREYLHLLTSIFE